MATYQDLEYRDINGNKTVFNKQTGQGYQDPTALAADLGIQSPQINWGAITTESLQLATPFPLTSTNDIPVYPVAGLNAEIPELKMTAPEQEASDLTKMLQGLTEQTVGESGYRATQEQAQGVPELYKIQTDLSARLKAIQNEALAIPLAIQNEFQGRGATVGGVAPIQTERLRNNAIQALGVSSALEASRGNLTLALDLVDRAVAQKFDPIREQITALTTNLNYIKESPEYTLAEKNRAQKQLDIQEAKKARIAKEEADMKKIYDLGIAAAQGGADALTIQNIQNARSPQEALVIAGDALGAEFKAKQEQIQFEKSLKISEFNLSVDKFNQDVEQFKQSHAIDVAKLGMEKQKMAQDYALAQQKLALDTWDVQLKNAEKLQPDMAAQMKADLLDDKINLIDSILTSPGLDSAVGPNYFSREGWSIQDSFGARSEFQGMVAQLVNKETIDTLVNLKERGGTLGALSDQERVLLQSAATKIGTWEIKKDGFGTGFYKVSEASFKKELEEIKRLAQKAKEKALGTFGLSSADAFLSAPLPNSNTTYSPNVWETAK